MVVKRPNRKQLAALILTVLGVSAGAFAFTRLQQPSVNAAAPTGTFFDNLVIVAMENQNYADVMGSGLGSANAPFIGTILNSGHSATYPNYHSYGAGIGGCSAGCYEALITGMQTMSDGYSCCTARPTVVDRLSGLGGTWQAYCESGCPRGPDHFPFIAFTPTSTQTSNIFTGSGVSTSTFIAAANSANPPNFLWFTPTDSHNMHDNSIPTGDAYIKTFFVGTGTIASPAAGSLLASTLFQPGHRTLLMFWWDEYDPSPQLLYSPMLIGSSTIDNGNSYTEYSWLHLIDTNWGLPTLTGNDASAVLPTIFNNPVPNYSLTTTPSSFSFQTGASGTSTIGATATGGFTSSIALSIASPIGLACSLSLPSITPGTTSTLSCSSTTVGSYTVTVTGVSGTLTRTATVQVQVTAPVQPDYSITTNPSSISFQTGGSGSSTIGITGLGGFTGSVSLSVPAVTGVTCTLVASLSPGQTSPLSCSSSTVGTYTVTINGVSGTITHSATVQVQVTNIPPPSGNFGSCTSLPQGWNCGNILGLSGTHATITNGVLSTVLVATGTGNDNAYQYATTQKGTFPWSPCQAPASGVLDPSLTTVTSTFTVNQLPVNNGRYVIYIALYYWLPTPASGGGLSYSCVDTQSRLENVGGVFTSVGVTSTFNPGDSFGWNVITLGGVSPGGVYTLAADVTTQCSRALGAYGIPASTPCQLAGIEIGVEGFQFTTLDLSWSGVSLIAGNPPPPGPLATAIGFTPSAPVTGQTVTFTATSTGGTVPYSQAWAFGDGTTGTGTSVVHAYTTAGTYTVTLTTTDSGSPVQTAIVSKSITVTTTPPPPPPPSGTYVIKWEGWDYDGGGEVTIQVNGVTVGTRPSSSCGACAQVYTPQSLTTTNRFHLGSNTLTFRQATWDFSGERNIVITNSTGAVVFSDSTDRRFVAGQVFTLTVFIGGTPPPPPLTGSFTFTPSVIMAGQSYTFTASATGGVSPYTFTWAFGDSGTGTGSPVTHVYSTAGTFTVVLTVRDNVGTTVTVSKSVTVNPIPPPLVVTFTYGLQVTFQASASGGTPPYTFSWSFGDGTTGIGANIVHTYATAGTYTVTVTVTDNLGVTASSTVTITV